MQFLFNDGNQDISRYAAPNLGLDGVLAVAQKMLDTQVLLDPFEKEFDLPTAFVQGTNRECGQSSVVGQKDQGLAGGRIFVTNAPQVLGIVIGSVIPVQAYQLIADNARTAIDRSRVDSAGIEVAFGAGHEKSGCLMQLVESDKIQITPVHHVKRACFDGQNIQDIDFVQLAIADVNKGGDSPSQIQEGMQFDSPLGGSKLRPRKQVQTQIDGCGIQSVNRVLQIVNKVVLTVELASPANQYCSQVGPNSPIAPLVGVGQSRALDGIAKAHAVELALIGQETNFDISQRLAPRELSKGHRPKLLGTRQAPGTGIAAIARHNPPKARPRNKRHGLCKDGLSDMHESLPKALTLESYSKECNGSSNRHQIKWPLKPCSNYTCRCIFAI